MAECLTFASTGFLPARGSLMLDFIAVAMLAIVVVMGYSVFQVRYRKNYRLHKTLQLAVGLTLLLTVTAFEVDIRFFTNWRKLAEPSPFFTLGEFNLVYLTLIIHLAFALPTCLIWIGVIFAALRQFDAPPLPGSHSRRHRFWGKLGGVGILGTAVTGWVFYFLAFVVS